MNVFKTHEHHSIPIRTLRVLPVNYIVRLPELLFDRLTIMPISVSIPTPLRPLTDNLDTVEVDGATVNELLSALDKKYPGIGERLIDAQGNVRRFVNIYVNGEDIRFLTDKETPVKNGDEVSIVPAIAGG
jgi:molybdopterin synthase sulfur carrier subunit